MLTTTQQNIADVLGVTAGSISSRFKTRGVPPLSIGLNGQRIYDLTTVIPHLRMTRERHKIADLIATSEDTGDHLYVGEDAPRRGKGLYDWLDRSARDRFAVIRTRFTEGLYAAGWHAGVEDLQWAVLLYVPILKHVILNDRRPEGPPNNWQTFAFAFAAVNFQSNQTTQTEAA